MEESVDIIVFTTVLSISIFGILANGIIIFVYARTAKYRKKHLFVLNLSFMNVCASFCYLLIAKRILLGSQTRLKGPKHLIIHDLTNLSSGGDNFSCKFEGFSTSLFAFGSIFQLAVVSAERAFVVRYPFLARKIHLCHKLVVCTLTYILSAFMTLPPLFGWGQVKLSRDAYLCCFAFSDQNFSNRSYFFYILVIGYLIPCFAIGLSSYAIIWFTVREAASRRRFLSTDNGRQVSERKPLSNRKLSISVQMKERVRLAVIMLLASAAFMISWTPFAILSLIGQFSNHVTPSWALSASSILAKSFVLNNALIYGFRDPSFRENLKTLLRHRRRRSETVSAPLEASRINNANSAYIQSRHIELTYENHTNFVTEQSSDDHMVIFV